MTDLHLSPDPGPPPRAFVFPFGQARAALAVGEALVQEIVALLDCHHEAAHTARHGFEGATRAAFDAGLADLTVRFEDRLAALRSDLGALEDDLALARLRQEASVDAIARHQAALYTHRSATGPPAPPDPSHLVACS
jgi:hypothetical protein